MKLTDEQKELYSLMLPVYGASVNQKTYCEILNIFVTFFSFLWYYLDN